jgi:hypothetical protein
MSIIMRLTLYQFIIIFLYDRFIESSFKGQLPGNFQEGLAIPEATRHVDELFNDMNSEVRQR